MELDMKQQDWTKIAEIELVYKTTVKPSQRPKIANPRDSYTFLLNTWDPNKLEFVEQFKVLLLNRAMKVLGVCEVSTGNVSGCIADPKLVFSAALKANASFIILAHNHPSGNPDPSETDRRLTDRMRTAGAYLDITVRDHIIVTTESYFSFADEGLL